MTREEFYKLTDILNSEVLGNFMHGGEADELIAMFEEAVEHSNILEQEEPVSETNKVIQKRRCLEEVAITINPFIDEVIEQFNLKDKSIVAKEIQYRGIGLKGDFGENMHRSDDEVIYILKEDKTVGLIVIRRTEFNNAEITMVKTEERFKKKSND